MRDFWDMRPSHSVGCTARACTPPICFLVALFGCASVDPTLQLAPVGDQRIVRLVVHIRGAEDGAGPIKCALYTSRSEFMTREGIVQGMTLPVSQGGADCEFQVPANQRIAISAFQDIDSDAKFDRGLLGLPIEPWGTSGDFSSLAPPDWRRSAIEIGAEGGEITIRLISLSEPPRIADEADR